MTVAGAPDNIQFHRDKQNSKQRGQKLKHVLLSFWSYLTDFCHWVNLHLISVQKQTVTDD